MSIEVKSQADEPVLPAWIINEKCAKQYLLGRAWWESGDHLR